MLVEQDRPLTVSAFPAASVVAAAPPAPSWLSTVEAMHAAASPAGAVVDAAIIILATAAAGSSAAVAVTAAAAFIAAAFVVQLYRHRVSLQVQGVLWYVRAALVPAGAAVLTLWRMGGSAWWLAASTATVALVGGRSALWLVVAHWRRRGFGLKAAVAVGSDASVAQLRRRVDAFPEAGMALAATLVPARLAVNGQTGRALARHILESGQAGYVLFSTDGFDERLVEECIHWTTGHAVHFGMVLPAGCGPRGRSHVGDLQVVPISSAAGASRRMVGKRVFDVVASAAMLVLLAPALAVVAAAVYLQDRGPVFYRHRRVGRGNLTFDMWKFRSMVPDADRLQADLEHDNMSTGLLFKLTTDPRITPVGSIIRRLSLDELPQLFNVLLGHMSLVGPRPLPVDPDAFDGLARRRHLVRPGVTGPWQVAGGNALHYDDMIQLDLAYIDGWSFRRDLSLLVRTLPAILIRRSPC